MPAGDATSEGFRRRDAPLYQLEVQPESEHHRLVYVDIQQYYVEGYLVERALALPSLDLRWIRPGPGANSRGLDANRIQLDR